MHVCMHSMCAALQVLRMQPAAVDRSGDSGDGAAAAKPARQAIAAAGGATAGAATDADVRARLFTGMVVWLAREVPREVLMLLVRSFGGVAAWDGPGSPYAESDERITHAAVDRPQQAHRRAGRVYVQPQWIFDCANFRVIASAEDYAPGRAPPPHLSPFETYGDGDYVPEAAVRLRRLQEAAEAVRRGTLEGPDGEMVGGFAGGAAEEAADGAGEAAARTAEADEERFVEELHKELGANSRCDACAVACCSTMPCSSGSWAWLPHPGVEFLAAGTTYSRAAVPHTPELLYQRFPAIREWVARGAAHVSWLLWCSLLHACR